jgi:SAM-dependent methyltransferase
VSDPSTCTFCGGRRVATHRARELRYGTLEEFAYGECGECHALELLDVPDDLGRYYPPEYPSFGAPGERLRHPLRRIRNQLLLGRRGPVARMVGRARPHPAAVWLGKTGTTRSSRILDVGSGAGSLLAELALAGFERLTGVDRYVDTDIDGDGYRVIKGTLSDVDGEFDLVMFHHSLEHMVDQRAAMTDAASHVSPDGWCLIRLPIVPNVAWQTYGTDWVQLDPPRHLVIHSVASLARIAAEAGLDLRAVDYDSTGVQFAGSEAYRRGLALDAMDRAFSAAEWHDFERRAADLNAARRGDQAALYFRRSR